MSCQIMMTGATWATVESMVRSTPGQKAVTGKMYINPAQCCGQQISSNEPHTSCKAGLAGEEGLVDGLQHVIYNLSPEKKLY